MPRWGMVIDLDRCTGCQACTVACVAENNIPFNLPQEYARGVTMLWNDFVVWDEGEYPEPRQLILPRPCMHCNRAPCVNVCPVGATYKREDGITMQRYDICIGCRSCMVACPYTVRVFNWFHAEERLEPFAPALNPTGQPVRPKGVVEKCIFCYHRLDRLKEDLRNGTAPRAVRERLNGQMKEGEEPSGKTWGEAIDILMRRLVGAGASEEDFEPHEVSYLPACVQTCTASARIFGDLDNPDSLVSEWARSPRAFVLLEEQGTLPNVIYLKEG